MLPRFGKMSLPRPIRAPSGSEDVMEPAQTRGPPPGRMGGDGRPALGGNMRPADLRSHPRPGPAGPDLQELLGRVARGDQEAFSSVYDAVSGPVLGLVRSVLRD